MRYRKRTARGERYSQNLEIIEQMVSYAFKERENEKFRKLQDLLERNASLVWSTPSFVYKDVYYTLWGRKREKGDNHLIHSSLLKEVSELLDEENFDEFIQKNKMKSYLNKVFSIATHTSDLYKLIPRKLHSFITQLPGDWSNGYGMTDKEIDQFRQENAQDYSVFNRFMLLDLLTS